MTPRVSATSGLNSISPLLSSPSASTSHLTIAQSATFTPPHASSINPTNQTLEQSPCRNRTKAVGLLQSPSRRGSGASSLPRSPAPGFGGFRGDVLGRARRDLPLHVPSRLLGQETYCPTKRWTEAAWHTLLI
uniref:Uncharacterized protein n=1 Tax=Leersia perrieri TaxID=77586 RepID=A0A0D9W5I3_9ORYZ